jgi:hypothetical protein
MMTRASARLVLGLCAVLVPVLVALQSATFAYVVSIERRLTRLETLQGLPAGARQAEPPGAATVTPRSPAPPGASQKGGDRSRPARARAFTILTMPGDAAGVTGPGAVTGAQSQRSPIATGGERIRAPGVIARGGEAGRRPSRNADRRDA